VTCGHIHRPAIDDLRVRVRAPLRRRRREPAVDPDAQPDPRLDRQEAERDGRRRQDRRMSTSMTSRICTWHCSMRSGRSRRPWATGARAYSERIVSIRGTKSARRLRRRSSSLVSEPTPFTMVMTPREQ
ncbi:hypothetical protein AcW1_002330, partial [Taiwanofungus camphoratus]